MLCKWFLLILIISIKHIDNHDKYLCGRGTGPNKYIPIKLYYVQLFKQFITYSCLQSIKIAITKISVIVMMAHTMKTIKVTRWLDSSATTSGRPVDGCWNASRTEKNPLTQFLKLNLHNFYMKLFALIKQSVQWLLKTFKRNNIEWIKRHLLWPLQKRTKTT